MKHNLTHDIELATDECVRLSIIEIDNAQGTDDFEFLENKWQKRILDVPKCASLTCDQIVLLMQKNYVFGNYIFIQPAHYFTDKERNLLCQILIEMRNDLETVEGADFNEALKILST